MSTDLDLLEAAWGLIANVSEGDWTKQSVEWREAADGWRDRYHVGLKKHHATTRAPAVAELSSEADHWRRMAKIFRESGDLDCRVIRDLRCENSHLREALRRLGSMEGFTTARTTDPERDAALLARIDFARAALKASTA